MVGLEQACELQNAKTKRYSQVLKIDKVHGSYIHAQRECWRRAVVETDGAVADQGSASVANCVELPRQHPLHIPAGPRTTSVLPVRWWTASCLPASIERVNARPDRVADELRWCGCGQIHTCGERNVICFACHDPIQVDSRRDCRMHQCREHTVMST